MHKAKTSQTIKIWGVAERACEYLGIVRILLHLPEHQDVECIILV